jgi:hypothetical protein
MLLILPKDVTLNYRVHFGNKSFKISLILTRFSCFFILATYDMLCGLKGLISLPHFGWLLAYFR